MITSVFGTSRSADRFVAGDDPLAIDVDPRHAARRRAGGDDDLARRAQRLRLALEDVDAAVAGEARRPLDPVDLVFLEEELNPFGQAADDAILARLHLRHVDRRGGRRPEGDSPVFGVLNDFERVRMLEQRLGRNAAPQETRAAERFLLLDDRGSKAELRGADGGHVPARAGADHDYVIVLGHVCGLGSPRSALPFQR
jgi:hypothetical protein